MAHVSHHARVEQTKQPSSTSTAAPRRGRWDPCPWVATTSNNFRPMSSNPCCNWNRHGTWLDIQTWPLQSTVDSWLYQGTPQIFKILGGWGTTKSLCFKKAASSIWFTCHSLTLFWTKKQRKKGETPAALEEAPLKVVHPNKGWNISSTKSSFFSLFASFSVFVFSLDLVDLLCVFFSRKDELLTDSADPANCQTQLLSASVDDSMTDDVIVESDHVEATAGPMGHRPWKNCPESFFLWTDGDTCTNCIIR